MTTKNLKPRRPRRPLEVTGHLELSSTPAAWERELVLPAIAKLTPAPLPASAEPVPAVTEEVAHAGSHARVGAYPPCPARLAVAPSRSSFGEGQPDFP